MQFWRWFLSFRSLFFGMRVCLGVDVIQTMWLCLLIKKTGRKYPYHWQFKLLGCMLQHLLNCFLAVGLACHLTFSKPNMHIFVARVVLTCHNFKLRGWRSSSGANWLFGLNYYIYEGCYAWMSYAILYYMIFRWMGRYLKGILHLVEMSLIYR